MMTTRKQKKTFRTELTVIEESGVLFDAKQCSKCSIVKKLTDFCNSKNGLGKRESVCKGCKNLKYSLNKDEILTKNKQWRDENKEKVSEYSKSYYLENKERIQEYKKSYRELNLERLRTKDRAYYHKTTERRKVYRKIYYQSNKETLLRKSGFYYEENKEKIREVAFYYRQRNLDSVRARDRRYYLGNKDKFHLNNLKRRALKSSLPDELTKEELNETLSVFSNSCCLTGRGADLHMDHVIPLASGHGGTIFGNIIPLVAELNLSKSDRNIFEWFESNRQRFELSQERFDRLIEWLASANAMTVGEYRDYVYWCHANPRSIDEIKTKPEAI